jgi:hypothetical protein
MSQAGVYYNFFRQTATTLLDDDPIDVENASSSVSTFYSAVPYHDKLLLFSSQSQHTLTSGDLLTNKTVSITLSTQYDSLTVPPPMNVGSSVLFAFPRGAYSGVREYFVQDNVDVNEAADVTAHVPNYILGNIVRIAVSTTEEFAVVQTDAGTNALWVYQWKWDQNSKVQSAWHEWTFDVAPVAADFVADVLYLVFLRPGYGMILEKIDLLRRTDPGVAYVTHLDHRCHPASASYDSGTRQTTLVIPTPHDVVYTVVSASGVQREVVSQSDAGSGTTSLVVQGNVATTAWVGVAYTFSYTFTPPFIKQPSSNGSGLLTNSDGRLQIKTMRVRYSDTGYFDVTVQPDVINSYVTKFRGRLLGSSNNVIGRMSLESDTLEFPVRARNENLIVTLTNDSFRPSAFLSAEWTGDFTPRSRRV